MKLICKELGLSIEIQAELMERISEAGRLHYPNEYGGLLIGHYSEDNQIVYLNDTVLPKKFKASPVSFERASDGMANILEEYFRQEPPQVYVGEWHTHPNGSPTPSMTDVRAFETIVKHPDVNIKNPVMLIMGLTRDVIKTGFYVYFNQKLYKYETV